MQQDDSRRDKPQQRVWLALFGALAGLALHGLAEIWWSKGFPDTLKVALFSFVLVQGSVTLALTGPLPFGRAFRGALWLSVPVALLIAWAAQRRRPPQDLFDDPATLAVAAVLVIVAAPFLLVRLTRPGDWRDPGALFDAAWTMHIRFLAAWVFVGVVWLALFLSDGLLSLVDIRIVRVLMRHDWFIFTLNGAVLGLGVAVAWELRETVSPFLILRLLRLLLPLALVVVVVFLLALPLRGLSRLFGEFSAATTLMGVAAAAITLIACALDRDEARATRSSALRGSARALALLLPVLAGLAVWAVAVRVGQYGWTPGRVLAALAAAVLLAYSAAYAVSALRPGWAHRIRGANVTLALVVAALAALWLTPVLNPYQIAAASQVARYLDGRSDLDGLPLWELAKDWGNAGDRALERLGAADDRPDHAELMVRIAEARAESRRFGFNRRIEERSDPALEKAARIAARIGVRPVGETVDARLFAALDRYQLDYLSDGCSELLPDGRPACVMVIGRFHEAGVDGREAVLVYRHGTQLVRGLLVRISNGAIVETSEVADGGTEHSPLTQADIAAILDGNYAIRPSGVNALWLGDRALVPAR